MGWTKGKKRGTSPRKGKSLGAIMPMPPDQLRAILQDEGASIADRWCTAMAALLPAMRSSSNARVAEVGDMLEQYWRVTMENVILEEE